MSKKLDRIGMNEKRAEDQMAAIKERLDQLRIRRKQIEDEEILRVIRGLKHDREELPKFLDGIESGRIKITMDDEEGSDDTDESADSENDPEIEAYTSDTDTDTETEDAHDEDLYIRDALTGTYSSAGFTDE